MPTKFEQFVSFFVKQLLDAKGFIVLKRDGSWSYTGMPEDIFPALPSVNFEAEHDEIPDEREGAWWEKER